MAGARGVLPKVILLGGAPKLTVIRVSSEAVTETVRRILERLSA